MDSENIRSVTTCRQLEEFKDTKGVIRIHISKKNRQNNGQKEHVQMDKQRSTKHRIYGQYTDNDNIR